MSTCLRLQAQPNFMFFNFVCAWAPLPLNSDISTAPPAIKLAKQELEKEAEVVKRGEIMWEIYLTDKDGFTKWV